VRIAAGDPDQVAFLHCDELYAEAVLDACRQLRDRLRMIAAARLGERGVDITDIMELKFSGGGVSDPEHPDMPVPLSEIIGRAIADGIDVKTTGSFNTLEVLGDRDFRDFACGAAAAEVLIDGFTGEVTVLRVDIVQDVGCQIEPLTEKNLICSAFMRGLGWLTCEELQWSANGELITGEVDSYRVPTAGEVPRQFNCELLPSQGRYPKDPRAAAFSLALSVREAIRDGIVAFGGAKPGLILPLPASPEAVYFTIETSAP
jgi:xanthine dehydrogenase large subunit